LSLFQLFLVVYCWITRKV